MFRNTKRRCRHISGLFYAVSPRICPHLTGTETKIADIADYHGSLDKEYQIKQKYINAPNHPRNPDANLKLDAIKRCFSLGEGVEYVSRDIGYSRASIYSWYRKY